MKKLKLLCSAFAVAAVLFTATSCDLELRDKIDLVSFEYDAQQLSAGNIYGSGSDYKIYTDTSINDFGDYLTLSDGIAISFKIENCGGDWSQLFQTKNGNIGLTCCHYTEDSIWKGNIWPAGYPCTNSPASAFDVFLNTSCYVTISISQSSITWYKDGERMFCYDDTNKNYGADTSVPTMATYCSGLLQAIKDDGIYCINPTDSWARGTGGDYNIYAIRCTKAVSDAEAETLYNTYGK